MSEDYSYMQNWCNEESRAETKYKLEAAVLLETTLNEDLRKLDDLSNKWDTKKETYDSINLEIKRLIEMYNSLVREQLPTFESYADAQFLAQDALEFDILPIYVTVFKKIEDLATHRSDIAKKRQQNFLRHLNSL